MLQVTRNSTIIISPSTGAFCIWMQRKKMMNKKRIMRIWTGNRTKICGILLLLVAVMVLSVCISCANDEVLIETTEVTNKESLAEGNEADGHVNDISADNDVSADAVHYEEAVTMITVHLCGEVCNPGVYELEAGSRIVDGIGVAGGFTEDACEDALNLAQEMSDGAKVYVPSLDEVQNGQYEVILGSEAVDSTSFSDSSKVNINTASMEKLMTLSGIGESRAKSIIAYRTEHGRFRSIEEIMNISGIKEASFEKIKDSITVN